MKTIKYFLACDLQDNPELIEEYKNHHKNVGEQIKESIRQSGVLNMEIYHAGTRLFMIMEVDENFSFEKKAEMDAANTKVQEWETLMGKYQKAIPGAKSGEKWVVMDRIFGLND